MMPPPHWQTIFPVAHTPIDTDRLDAVLSGAVMACLPELADRLSAAGINIDRMGCPNLSRQLASAGNAAADCILCAALDADETIPVQAAIARDWPGEVRLAVRWLERACGAQSVMIVSDRRTRPIRGEPAGAITHRFIDRAYPALHPSVLLGMVLRRDLLPGRLPVEQRAIVIDAAAAWTIARMLTCPENPAVPLAVRDERNLRTARTRYALAAPTLQLADVLGELSLPGADENTIIRSGARHRDLRIDPAARVGEVDSAILISTPAAATSPEPCTRCGWCADVCPTAVRPALVLEGIQTDRPALARAARADRCLDCGLCQHVCPARLPLLRALRATAIANVAV